MKRLCLHNGTVLSGYAAMENHSVLAEEGKITGIFPAQRFEQKHFGKEAEVIDAEGAFITPGFIDTHIHGYGGFGTDDALYPEVKPEKETVDSMIELSRLLAAKGVTAFNPTVYPAPQDSMIDMAAKMVSAMGREDGAKIMGLHLEGPFLSPLKPGVMRPGTISPVDINLMERLWNAARGHIVNMTVAPEIENMEELARFCAKKGIILQAGHTNASYENIIEGMQMGIFHSTHVFNAMSKLDQRYPNAVGAILTHSEMSCEIIADGFHVHPAMIKLLAQNKPAEKIVLITDSLKCTGQETGPFFANGEEMIFAGGVFRRKKDDVIAGSGITMLKGIQNLVQFGFSLENAVKTASSNPARVMRYAGKGILAEGMDADIAVFNKDFTLQAVIRGGKLQYRNI